MKFTARVTVLIIFIGNKIRLLADCALYAFLPSEESLINRVNLMSFCYGEGVVARGRQSTKKTKICTCLNLDIRKSFVLVRFCTRG